MKGGSGRWGLVAGLALVVGANALLLARVAANRSGAPAARLELTQRELTLPWRSDDDEENTGLALSLSWNSPRDSETWFDRAKLVELGFDDASLRPCREDRPCRTPLPRDVWVVLEMAGDSWRRWLTAAEAELERAAIEVARGEVTAKTLELRRRSLARERVEHTRLFAVDAGLDAEALRRRYPDPGRFAVVPARVGVSFSSRKDEPPVCGRIESLAVPQLHVPLARRPVLDWALGEERRRSEEISRTVKDDLADELADDLATSVDAREPRPPLYRATVVWGRRHEAWLAEVARLQPQAAEE